jgi:hypothetical protein
MSKALALSIAEELDFEYGTLMSEYLVNEFAEIIYKHIGETKRKPLSAKIVENHLDQYEEYNPVSCDYEHGFEAGVEFAEKMHGITGGEK